LSFGRADAACVVWGHFMGIFSKGLTALVAIATGAGSANAACWSDTAYQAAQLRELDTMLMVEALRCRKTNANFVETYNRFVVASRPALLNANAALKGHFAQQVGGRGALSAYDNYMTTVANRYGAGTAGLGCEDMASIVEAALGAGGAADALNGIVEAANMVPAIAGERCTGGSMIATMASRR
jgi:hypothetical protein